MALNSWENVTANGGSDAGQHTIGRCIVHMPGIAVSAISSTQPSRISRTKFGAPPPDCLVGNRHAAFGEEILDIPKAERESVVEPNRVLDDVRRKTVAALQGFRRHHGRSLPEPQLMRQYVCHEASNKEVSEVS